MRVAPTEVRPVRARSYGEPTREAHRWAEPRTAPRGPWKGVCASAPASRRPTGRAFSGPLSALAPHLSGWEHDRVDLEVSLKDTGGPDQKVTLQAWLAGRSHLVATSHERDLDHALAEVRSELIRQIEDERSRREPRKRRKTRNRTS